MMKKTIQILFIHLIINAILIFTASSVSAQSKTATTKEEKKIVAFGTTINPKTQLKESQELAISINAIHSEHWQSRGDQRRLYRFPDTRLDIPYRLYIPTTWDGKSKLPLIMFLHGAFNDENSYVDADDKLMIKLAEKHGFILLSPLGYDKLGAYGTCLLLPALFGKPNEVAQIMAKQTAERWKTLEYSEKDVINVLELVQNEYSVDTKNIFLTGHSMGSGGTWYLGAKYSDLWKAIAPMSGPFVDEELYPWQRISKIPVFVTEGTKSASIVESRNLAEWMKKKGFKVEYKEVDADHGGMVPLVLPEVFDFLKKSIR